LGADEILESVKAVTHLGLSLPIPKAVRTLLSTE
jgi:hypothetical protein